MHHFQRIFSGGLDWLDVLGCSRMFVLCSLSCQVEKFVSGCRHQKNWHQVCLLTAFNKSLLLWMCVCVRYQYAVYVNVFICWQMRRAVQARMCMHQLPIWHSWRRRWHFVRRWTSCVKNGDWMTCWGMYVWLFFAQGWKKSWFKQKSKKSDFFYLNRIFWFLKFFLHFSVLLCIVVALNNLNCIVSCTLHRIKVPEPVTIN